ncbi:hypothetical protein CQW23_16273 [Capsicum baccatum]|uniref:Uncharacterized protein n=1 Tax=Capsicum baccatum TaxID=33114 RepID=A0A2G2WAH2_CAPBA|nr:hypothetical protein CQW23_16273 [Capsicum baccatum]
MVYLLRGERRGLNPHVVDSQSTALIYLATSSPTLVQVEVSIYDQILSEIPYNRLSKRSFFCHYSGGGRAVKANLVDSERAASTYCYQNEKQQVKLELEEASLYQRKPLQAIPLYRVPNLCTPKLQAFFEAPTTWDI